MDIHTDSHQVSRLEVVDTGRRRRWTDAEKLRILEESFSRPRNASATARRYGISNQLLFAWRKAYREGRFGGAPLNGFVPAVLVPEVSGARDASSTGGRMEVVSASGRRVVVGPDFDPRALGLLLEVLEQPPVCRSLGEGRPVRRSTECAGG
jgi:transposase